MKYQLSICRPTKLGFYRIHEGNHQRIAYWEGFRFFIGPRMTENNSCVIIEDPKEVHEWSEWDKK